MRDETAFVEFAQAVRGRLRRTAYLMCGDWDQASDHVQEGLIRVYVAWPRLTRAGGEYAYARKAVVSAFIDHARRRSSTEVVGHPDHDVPSGHDVADTATALGCSEGTVKSQTSRALVSLRSMFDGSPLGELVTEGASSW